MSYSSDDDTPIGLRGDYKKEESSSEDEMLMDLLPPRSSPPRSFGHVLVQIGNIAPPFGHVLYFVQCF